MKWKAVFLSLEAHPSSWMLLKDGGSLQAELGLINGGLKRKAQTFSSGRVLLFCVPADQVIYVFCIPNETLWASQPVKHIPLNASLFLPISLLRWRCYFLTGFDTKLRVSLSWWHLRSNVLYHHWASSVFPWARLQPAFEAQWGFLLQ